MSLFEMASCNKYILLYNKLLGESSTIVSAYTMYIGTYNSIALTHQNVFYLVKEASILKALPGWLSGERVGLMTLWL